MKKLFIIAALVLTANLHAQSNGFNFVDYDKPYVNIVLQRTIEIDGHTFDNKKSKDPIKFEADLDGVKIYDSKKEYTRRKCKQEICKIIHLEDNKNKLIWNSINIPLNTNGL